jgi:transcription initiation factor TFIIH subunit 1
MLIASQALFCSKEGAAQVRLKIGLVSDETGHNFTFLAPQAVAVSERERFKTELGNIISVNRRGLNTSNSVPPPITPISAQSFSNAPSPRPTVPLPRSSTSRAPSVAASESRQHGTPLSDPTSDYQLRIRVLLNNPELAALHRELVMSRHITENEFWEGREVLFVKMWKN